MKTAFSAPDSAESGEGRQIDRRKFLKIGGAGIASSLLLGPLVVNFTASSAGSQEASSQSALMKEFREASREYDIPMDLLVAMGYVNTRWEMPEPNASEYEEGDLHGWGGYGIMALVQNPSTNTLGEASELTGIPEEKLKTDRAANIRGGAALLARSKGERKPEDVSEWFGSVVGRTETTGEGFEAPAGVGGGDIFAEQVFGIIKSGASGKTSRGEQISLAARELEENIQKKVEAAMGGL